MKIPLPILFLLEFEIASSSPPPDQYSVRAIFQMSVESNPRLHWLSFSLLCDWVRKLASHSQPIRCKTKTYPDLVARVFPRFRLIGCSYFEFSLGLRVIFLSFDWLLRFIGFFLYDTQSKSVRYWWPVFLLLYSVRRTQNQSSKSSRNCGVKYNKVRGSEPFIQQKRKAWWDLSWF